MEKLLFTQFHDAVAGTCIAEAYEDICDIYGEVLNEGNIILNNALQALASKIDTRGPGIPVIVFNSHSWAVRFPVEVEGVNCEESLLDRFGQIVPMQRIKSSANVRDWRQRVVFIAECHPRLHGLSQCFGKKRTFFHEGVTCVRKYA